MISKAKNRAHWKKALEKNAQWYEMIQEQNGLSVAKAKKLMWLHRTMAPRMAEFVEVSLTVQSEGAIIAKTELTLTSTDYLITSLAVADVVSAIGLQCDPQRVILKVTGQDEWLDGEGLAEILIKWAAKGPTRRAQMLEEHVDIM